MATGAPGHEGPVLGAVDGKQAWQVARYAAAEAARTRRPLLLVHVADDDAHDTAAEAAKASAGAVLEPLTAEIRNTFPDLVVRSEALRGPAAERLVDHSGDSSVLVVGHSGKGGIPRLPTGSVSWHVATHSACPVIVLRPDDEDAEEPKRRVSVGVDSPRLAAENTEFTLPYALRAAARHGADLDIVYAASQPEMLSTGPAGPAAVLGDDLFAAEERLLEEATGRLRQEQPDVRISARLVPGRAASVLTEASRDADLVVVGSQGRTGVRRLMLGSVSAEVLHTASCPVAVVPQAA